MNKFINQTKTTSSLLLILIFFCAFTIRIYGIHKFDLWFDEIATDSFSDENIRASAKLFNWSPTKMLIYKMKNDPHSMLYFVIINIYSRFFGNGKSLRYFSVAMSMLALFIFYRLARLFLDEKTCLYALALFALNPFHLWYAQEARVYALASLLTLLSLYIFFLAIRTDKKIYWIMWPLINLLALLCTYFTGFLLMLTALPMFSRENRPKILKWFLSLILSFGGLILFYPVMVSQFNFVKTCFWLHSPTWEAFWFTWMIFTLGYTGSNYIHYVLNFIIFVILGVWGFYVYFQKNKIIALTFLLFLIFPVTLVFIISQQFAPVYINRQLIIFSPFYYLFIALGFQKIRDTSLKTVFAISALVLLSISIFNYHQGYLFTRGYQQSLFIGILPKRQTDDLWEYFQNNVQEGDLVISGNVLTYVFFRDQILKLYHKKKEYLAKGFHFLFFPGIADDFTDGYIHLSEHMDLSIPMTPDVLYSYKPYSGGEIKIHRFNKDDKSFKRLWVLTGTWSKYGRMQYDLELLREFMYKHYTRVYYLEKENLHLELFENKPPPPGQTKDFLEGQCSTDTPDPMRAFLP